MDLLFDVTGEDIAKLNDEDLRSLIGRLCEAEYLQLGLPISEITWGGKQEAKDGGLDVVVNSVNFSFSIDFIPRNHTGFQVKKSNITSARIKKEMRPKGGLRESIKNLIQLRGAYLIVSSGSSTSDTALHDRIKAMKLAVSECENHENLHLDFLDSSRIASWVRKHPSIILWLRNKVGRPLKGWQPYGNWSGNSIDPTELYILDEKLRLRSASYLEGDAIDSTSALLKFRSLLSSQRVSLRLTGLSGVGKTRFIQALFEEIEENSLNKNLAIYADISHSLMPDPKTIAEQLIALGTRAILIIDNCPPELHRTLTTICTKSDSKVNLLTIEYDMREDLPEDTDVFILEPSSDDLIKKLILIKFPKIGQLNAKTVSEVAGGNARVAIALAGTVKRKEALPTLQDDVLFSRLFKQQNFQNDNLLRSAEVCSLVYSFEGTKVHNGSELEFLAGIIETKTKDLFRDTELIKKRNLIQARGVWRALLPHAIANRLAKNALESIPLNTITDSFQNGGTERLIISFSRRLSYLNDCTQAIEIASRWLKPDGLLGLNKGNLNTFRIKILNNIAPIVPEGILVFMEEAAESNEKFTSRENPNYQNLIKLLQLVAYEAKYFDRSVKLICRFALTEILGEKNNSIRSQLSSLFQIYLSGTHATLNQRCQVVSRLLNSVALQEQELGLFLLNRSLMYGSVTGFNYSFGARLRDYGWHPNPKQIFEWYVNYIELCGSMAIQNDSRGSQVRKLLGNNFRGLWKIGLDELDNILEAVAIKIHKSQSWYEGWVAVKSILRYDNEYHQKSNLISRLIALEKFLRPQKLIEQTRAFLFRRSEIFDFGDEHQISEVQSRERMHKKAKEIGALIANDLEASRTLLPELLSINGEILFSLGKGFGEDCMDSSSSWETISSAMEIIPFENRAYKFILGFLNASSKRDREFYQATMESLVTQDLFSKVFPFIQTRLEIDLLAIKRLKRSLEYDVANITDYVISAHSNEEINDAEFFDLQNLVLIKNGGSSIVIENLYNRLQKVSEMFPLRSHSASIIEFAGKVLLTCNFPGNELEDHMMAFLIKGCFKDNKEYVKAICRNLRATIKNSYFQNDHQELIRALASVQPLVVLDIFVGEAESKDEIYFITSNPRRDNPFDLISDSNIKLWGEDNRVQIPLLITYIGSFLRSNGSNLSRLPVINELLEIAPNLSEALKCFRISLEDFQFFDSWMSNSKESLQILNDMKMNKNGEISSWARSTYSDFEDNAKRFSETANKKARSTNETFE